MRGAVDAGLLPGLLPGGRRLADPGPVAESWSRLPDAEGLDARGILEAAAAGEITALFLAGVDPVADFEDPALALAALERVDTLVVADLLPTGTTRCADVVLPAASSQERVGSFTTWEGRRQPFPQALPAQGLVLEDWDIVRQLARELGTDLGWETAMDVRREAAPLMEAGGPGLADLPAPADAPAEGRTDGADGDPRGLRAVVVPQLLDSSTMLLGADALQKTARTPVLRLHPEDARRLGIAHGERGAVRGPEGRIELEVAVRPTVVEGSCVLPAHVDGAPTGILASSTAPLVVTVEPLAVAGAGASTDAPEAATAGRS